MTVEGLKTRDVTVNTQEITKDILSRLSFLNRNIVSDEFEESLEYLRKYIDIKVHQYKSGSECWTWNVPQKWKINDGFIKRNGEVIVSIKDHPLHVMSYSTPVKRSMKGEELKKHIYTHKEIPEAIPYEFSFYIPKWGYCLTHEQAKMIKDTEEYEVVIDSEFVDDYLSVGEYTIKGSSNEHVFILSHVDHPFQVNDGIIGVASSVALAKLLEKQKDLYYNYTFLYGPETIGSIAYLSHNEHLIPKIRYSIFAEMIGLKNPLIIQESFRNDCLINRYAAYVLRKTQGEAKSYPFLTVAGNDEKVFDSPGVSVPSISLTRVDQEGKLKKRDANPQKLTYPYPQYHSHLDDLSLVDSEAVEGAVNALEKICQVIEKDFIPKRKFTGPVFLTKFDLWADWRKDLKANENIMRLMYMLEGDQSVFEIAEKLDMDFEDLVELLNKFYDKQLITKEYISIEFDRTR